VVERLRLVKDAHEVEMLRRGGLLLSAVALDVIQDVKAGMTEQDVAAKIDWRIKSAGFERCSFETIVAGGPNAALPHAHAGDRVLRAGDLVVLDFGDVYGGYCVDLTRRSPLGRPTPRCCASAGRCWRLRMRPSVRPELVPGGNMSRRRSAAD
jgi:Xaa-Pro aminopeptidase